MRKQPVSVSVSRGFFEFFFLICVAHVSCYSRFLTFFIEAWNRPSSKKTPWVDNLSALLLIPTTSIGRNGDEVFVFYKFLKKLNATRKLPKSAKVMLTV